MEYYMRMANLLAENLYGFIDFVENNWENKTALITDQDKWYQVKLFIDEYKLRVIADELERINRFCWNESYTTLLVNDLEKALQVINEFVARNENDLFFMTARMHTLNNLSSLLKSF